MTLRSRWYLCRAVRGSTLAQVQRRGFYPSVFEHLSQPQRVGQWVGFLPVEQLHAGICVVGFDDEVVDPVEVAGEFAALQAAPDAAVFDVRSQLSARADTWARSSLFTTTLETLNVDSGRIASSGKTVLHVFREAARQLLLYQRLGRNLPTLALTASVGDIPTPFRRALNDRLLEMGFPSSKLAPSPTESLRAWYRDLLDGFAPELERGAWHLARRELNLSGPSEASGGIGVDV